MAKNQWRALVIVALGGLNLILINWVLVREMTALLLGTELVVLAVSASYFLGLSFGYVLAGRVRQAWFVPLAALTLILHLTLPVWFQMLVTYFDGIRMYWIGLLLLPILTVLFVPAFYSVFLPHFADSGHVPLPLLYGVELLGSAAGVGVLVIFGAVGMQAVYGVYLAALIVIIVLLGARRLSIPLLIIGVAWWAVLPQVYAWSNARFFEAAHNLAPGSHTAFTGYSPYQKVDIIEEPDGRRYLFLDGLEHFGSRGGSRLNVILGRLPAQLIDPYNALVIGAGSMELERMIAEIAAEVETVEIDPMVVDASLKYFDVFNRMSVLQNRRIIIDDAKHYLANTDTQYDLIATDTPAAFTIQTATLYSAPFYALIKERLYGGGVLAANLTSTFSPESITARRIAAGILASFDEMIVVTSYDAGWSFGFASDDLSFTKEDLEAALRAIGETNYELFSPEEVRAIVGDAQPITLDSMDIVLLNSWDYVEDLLP